MTEIQKQIALMFSLEFSITLMQLHTGITRREVIIILHEVTKPIKQP